MEIKFKKKSQGILYVPPPLSAHTHTSSLFIDGVNRFPFRLDYNNAHTVFVKVIPMCYISSGSTIVLRKKFSAQHFWSDCRRYKVTTVPYVGEVMRYLVSQPKVY